jgi:hypothetical protein
MAVTSFFDYSHSMKKHNKEVLKTSRRTQNGSRSKEAHIESLAVSADPVFALRGFQTGEH